jgi:hypothetical protein
LIGKVLSENARWLSTSKGSVGGDDDVVEVVVDVVVVGGGGGGVDDEKESASCAWNAMLATKKRDGSIRIFMVDLRCSFVCIVGQVII